MSSVTPMLISKSNLLDTAGGKIMNFFHMIGYDDVEKYVFSTLV